MSPPATGSTRKSATVFSWPDDRDATQKGTRSQRLRTLAGIPVEVELRGPPKVPIYQRIAPEAARLHDASLTLKDIGKHFAVDDHTAAKAVRWFRQR